MSVKPACKLGCQGDKVVCKPVKPCREECKPVEECREECKPVEEECCEEYHEEVFIPEPPCDVITDTDILNFLLMKYQLNKCKLIELLRRRRLRGIGIDLMNKFYFEHPCIVDDRDFKCQVKFIHDIYGLFCDWNCSDVVVTYDEFEDYYWQYFDFD